MRKKATSKLSGSNALIPSSNNEMSLIERLLSSANALLLDSFFATFAASIVVITLDAMLAPAILIALCFGG